MAKLQVTYMSLALLRTVTLQVILPVDKFSMAGGMPEEHAPYKTLYLLHGVFGSDQDWITGTRVSRWAAEHDLAVVMPAGENSFYVDRPVPGSQYASWIGEELVEVTRRMFPLSRRREDTFIAGLSMGGYGAVYNGLSHPETFSCVASFSGALHLFDPDAPKTASQLSGLTNDKFGGMDTAAASGRNPAILLKQLAARHAKGEAELPRIYLSCGVDDGLIKANRRFRSLFTEAGYDLTWYEGPGAHEWDFWDDQIHRLMDWLPLGEASEGLSSGHVNG